MNVEKLNESIAVLKRDLGEALLATDIFTMSGGVSLVGINTQPKACALFNKVSLYLIESLKGSGFPELNDYYLINLKDGKMVLALYLLDYQWGFLLDSNKVQLGILHNVIIPKAKAEFMKAFK